MKTFLKTVLSGVVVLMSALSLCAAGFAPAPKGDPDLKTLWSERLASIVSVEFYVQAETERHVATVNGTVIDHDGTIIIAGSALPTYLPPSQFKNFRIHRPGVVNTEYSKGEYIGYDIVSGFHFVRVEPSGRTGLRPITDWVVSSAVPVEIGDEVWGAGVRNKEEDFSPFLLRSLVTYLNSVPQETAYAESPVAGPMFPVFNLHGAFVGLAMPGFGESFLAYTREERGAPLLLLSGDHSHVFRLASDVLPYLNRVPKNKMGRPIPWMGVTALQPLPLEVAKYLKLDNQSGIVVSDIVDSGPAEKSGLKERDIILALDGKPLPRFKPPQGVVAWFEKEVFLRQVGAGLALSVLRGGQHLELKLTLADEPKILREAERKYYERLGFSVREFVMADAIANRIKLSESEGAVVHFVKGNSPVSAAGLRAEDWVREIDGVEIKTYADAIQKLDTIEKDQNRAEFVILVSRSGETSVLRVRLR
jgi:serine protease Do